MLTQIRIPEWLILVHGGRISVPKGPFSSRRPHFSSLIGYFLGQVGISRRCVIQWDQCRKLIER